MQSSGSRKSGEQILHRILFTRKGYADCCSHAGNLEFLFARDRRGEQFDLG